MNTLDYTLCQLDDALTHLLGVAEARFIVMLQLFWELDQDLSHSKQGTQGFGCTLFNPPTLSDIAIDEDCPFNRSLFTANGRTAHVEDDLASVRGLHQHVTR